MTDDEIPPDVKRVAAASGIPRKRRTFPTGLVSTSIDISKDKSILGLESLKFQRRQPSSGPLNRNFNWFDYGVITPPEDQDKYTACVSYSACAVAEAKMLIARMVSAKLAPLYMHFCILELEPQMVTSEFWFAERASEKGLPYSSSADRLKEKAQCGHFPEPPLIRPKTFYRFTNEVEVKQELASNGPLVMHMKLYDSFHNGYETGIYRTPATERSQEKHAVCIIGYDDDQKCWIGKNSLGTDWGKHGGFFRLAYGACEVLTPDYPAWSFDF